MAGMALHGDLTAALADTSERRLTHRLESVKFLPPDGFDDSEPQSYGILTQAAVALPEIEAPERPRIYCMAVTNDNVSGATASGWSAALDQAAVGRMIADGDDDENEDVDRWKPSRPYHVALEDSYVRAHWDEISALCKLNSIPFNATGEKIRDEGLWCVYEFTWQMDAILFWDRFEGRWLRGSEFHHPERPKDLPTMTPLKNWPKFDPRNTR
jgi:hypothetical protein